MKMTVDLTGRDIYEILEESFKDSMADNDTMEIRVNGEVVWPEEPVEIVVLSNTDGPTVT